MMMKTTTKMMMKIRKIEFKKRTKKTKKLTAIKKYKKMKIMITKNKIKNSFFNNQIVYVIIQNVIINKFL